MMNIGVVGNRARKTQRGPSCPAWFLLPCVSRHSYPILFSVTVFSQIMEPPSLGPSQSSFYIMTRSQQTEGLELGVPAHTCNLSPWEAEARGPRVSNQPWLHSKNLSQTKQNKTKLLPCFYVFYSVFFVGFNPHQ